MEEQRLPKTIALAVFSSDALSSTAYATEEILFVVAVGASSLALGLEQAGADRDRRRGAARDRDRLVPAGDLRLPRRRRRVRREPREHRRDARRSSPARRSWSTTCSPSRCRSRPASPRSSRSPRSRACATQRVELGVVLIVLDHAAEHARRQGVRDASSRSRPTSTCACSARSSSTGSPVRTSATSHRCRSTPKLVRRRRARSAARLGIFLLLKGFSSGAVALTGVEAISNGVPAFRRPESKNAATTLVWMGVLLGSAVLRHLGARPPAAAVPEPRPHGDGAARARGVRQRRRCSCCCSSRPRRSSCSPRTPRTTGSRACRRSSPRTATCRASSRTAATGSCSRTASSCSRGAAALLLVAFGGLTNALIPLYAVGVFTSFTLSQSGMVRHHLRLREPGWRRSVVLNARRRGRDARRAARSSRSRSSATARGCRSS